VASVSRTRTSTEAKVLSFAAVGSHGREWLSRLASSALTLAALAVALPASAQSPANVDYPSWVVSQIADAIGAPGPVRLLSADDPSGIQAELVRLLAARGYRLTESDDATPIRWSCGENLRERVCVVEVGAGAQKKVSAVSRPRDAGGAAAGEPVVAIALQPLHAQRGAMLDVARAGDNLLVLASTDVRMIAIAEAGRTIAAQPITTLRIWPRDLRGRLRVTANAIDVFLPGARCRGTISPFVITCADEGDAWPIGLQNTGMTPGRNTFATPEGLIFYDTASLGGDRSVVVGEGGVLTFLDERRQVVARGASAEHVLGLSGSCAAAPFVVVGGRSADRGSDVLRLFRVVNGQLAPMPSTFTLPGILTALWVDADARGGTAIVHDVAAGRYEALHLTLSCAR
jgi:hypothetical protein